MTFAVIKTGGKQYKVAANDLVRIEKIPGDAGDVVTFENVLMVDDAIGVPLVDGALVAGEVVEQFRDKKVIVFKKKRRQGYRRKNGHRQELTLVRITEILTRHAPGSAVHEATLAARPLLAAAVAAALGGVLGGWPLVAGWVVGLLPPLRRYAVALGALAVLAGGMRERLGFDNVRNLTCNPDIRLERNA
jgi:ribosomal protein L21